MGEELQIPSSVVIRLVFFTLEISLAVMALGFGSVVGLAQFFPGTQLEFVFGALATALTVLLIIARRLRRFLVELLSDLAADPVSVTLESYDDGKPGEATTGSEPDSEAVDEMATE